MAPEALREQLARWGLTDVGAVEVLVEQISDGGLRRVRFRRAGA